MSNARSPRITDVNGIGQVYQSTQFLCIVAYSILMIAGRAISNGVLVEIEGKCDFADTDPLLLHLHDGRQIPFQLVSSDPTAGEHTIRVSAADL